MKLLDQSISINLTLHKRKHLLFYLREISPNHRTSHRVLIVSLKHPTNLTTVSTILPGILFKKH